MLFAYKMTLHDIEKEKAKAKAKAKEILYFITIIFCLAAFCVPR